jgi:tetratricopeptide (TPR) repeat protein
MFVTFFSYKGGVGRTLALANVAYLLATNEDEPCRVLLWDFDLEAPGLPHLFRCRWGAKKQGFVDLVDRYLEKAELPSVTEYIYPSNVSGVDVIPAGHVDRKYSDKLEKINWRLVYEKAHGYDLLESIKESIKKIQPKYDYVLVDSRTGYSDVGGICLHQLPDLVVLMFRLNNQNLDGTQKVASAIHDFCAKTKKHVDTIPVVSPAWPFGTTEANDQVRRARSIFPKQRLLNITFDANLTFAEKLIVRDQAQYEITPRILQDYKRLAAAVRTFNLQDRLTVFNLGKSKLANNQFEEAYEYFATLIQQRPEKWSYWTWWVKSARFGKVRDRAESFLNSFIQDNPKVSNAFLARASLRRKPAAAVLVDLTLAIEADPSNPQAYWDRGQFFVQADEYSRAFGDFEKYFQLTHEHTAFLQLGLCLMQMEQYERAAEYFVKLLEKRPRDPESHRLLGRAYLGMGQFANAKIESAKSLELKPDVRLALWPMLHAMAGLGEATEALPLLGEAVSRAASDLGELLNCVETYIVLEEPVAAMKLLEGWRLPISPRYAIIRDLFLYIASILQGERDEAIRKRLRATSSSTSEDSRRMSWSFLELKTYLLFPTPSSRLSEDDRLDLRSLIEHLETLRIEPDQFGLFSEAELSDALRKQLHLPLGHIIATR